MRGPRYDFRGSICDFLIILLIVCFIFQCLAVLTFGEVVILETTSLSYKSLASGYLWSLISYGLVHEGVFHLLFNILGLHFIGRIVSHSMSRNKFILFTVFSLLAGGLAWLLVNSSHSINGLIGFSAAVLSYLTFYCMLRPHQPITLLLLFVLPVTLRPRFILLATLGLETYGLIFAELTSTGSIAHSAHLGGMLCGLILFVITEKKYLFPLRFRFGSNSTMSHSPQPNSSSSARKFKVNFTQESNIQQEIDRILDKINDQGFGSLTPAEKASLEKAKKILGKS